MSPCHPGVSGWPPTRPHTPPTAKALLVAALAYVLLPLDLVSDFIPVLGWLDDLAVVMLAITLFKRLAVRAHLAG